MQRSDSDFALHGVIGGLLAGAVVVLWFLAVDLAAGQAFETPGRLAAIAMGETYNGPWPRHIAVFTVLHFGIFAALGIVAVRLLQLMELDPGVVVGAVFGVAVLNGVHYAGLMITGTDLLTVVPVAHVSLANMLGGIVMMTYLHGALKAETPLGWNVLRSHPVLYEGILVGVVGAVAVATWLFLVDLATGRPLHTAAAFGSSILLGARSASEISFNLGVILAYSVLHVTAFVVVGVAFAWVARRAHQARKFWTQAVVMLLLLELMFFGTVPMVSGWVIEDVGLWVLVVANAMAIISMGVWLWHKHPDLEGGLTGMLTAEHV